MLNYYTEIEYTVVTLVADTLKRQEAREAARSYYKHTLYGYNHTLY